GRSGKASRRRHGCGLQGKERNDSTEGIAVYICSVAKIDDIHTGDVLHDDHALDSVHLRPIVFPTPMFGMAVTPKARGDEQKISAQLTKLAEEDPTFKFHTDRQT